MPEPAITALFSGSNARVASAFFLAKVEHCRSGDGEVLSYVAQSNSDDDFSRALAGAKYRETRMANRIGLDEIAPVIEFSRELIHDDQDNAEYAVSSKEARPNPHNVIMSLTVTADSEWKFGGAYNHSIRDQDSLASAFIRYEPNDNLWISLSAYDYDGRDGTLFGRFRRNDNVEFKLNYSF